MSQFLRVIYKPESGSRQEWEIDLQNPAWDLHKAAPKAAGLRGWAPFSEALGDMDADAWQALIWALRRRRETKLNLNSVEFPTGLLAEVDFATQCPACKEWLTTEDGEDDHDCPADREGADGDDEDGDAQEGEEPGEA